MSTKFTVHQKINARSYFSFRLPRFQIYMNMSIPIDIPYWWELQIQEYRLDKQIRFLNKY